MKKYKKYMDGVQVSDTLRRRLKELKAPPKPAAWKRYGAAAAALVLVFGLGGYGLHYYDTVVGERLFLDAIRPGGRETDLDLVPEGPAGAVDPAEKTLGGYEYRGEDGTIQYCVLPRIEYGAVTAGEQKISMDWAIAEGASERELTGEEITALLGGAEVVSQQLDWDGYKLSGRVWERPDGSLLIAFLGGWAGPLDHFEFSVMEGGLPPACVAYAESVTQEVRGLTVIADKHDGEHGCGRRVSFMKENYGYRFDLTSTDPEGAELLVSRLVCRVADRGLNLTGGTFTCDSCGGTFPAGTAHDDPDGLAPEEGGVPKTAYDPGAGQYGPVSVSPAVDVCGTPEEAPWPEENTPDNFTD